MAERGPAAQWLHRQAREATAVAGRATAPLRMLPSFLIVGAQRAGTTSLYQTLTRHPDVLPAGLHKGVHYFDTAYDRGPRWYRAHFPLTLTQRRRERHAGGPVVTGEASPYYMFHPLVAERIARDLPDVRVVVMLRDPVERAWSAFTHEKARGFETEDFERAVELEPQRLAGVEEQFARDPFHVSPAHQHNAYLTRGHYADQLERLEQHLGRERIHVVDSDELFVDAAPQLRGITDFLGIAPWVPDEFAQRNARPRRALEGAVRDRLEEYFEPHDARLAQWWGRTPSWRS